MLWGYLYVAYTVLLFLKLTIGGIILASKLHRRLNLIIEFKDFFTQVQWRRQGTTQGASPFLTFGGTSVISQPLRIVSMTKEMQ